jgi:hypothetical protein
MLFLLWGVLSELAGLLVYLLSFMAPVDKKKRR